MYMSIYIYAHGLVTVVISLTCSTRFTGMTMLLDV